MVPPALIEVNARTRLFGGAALYFGQTAAQLFERAIEAVPQAEIGEGAGPRHEQRANFVFVEVRECPAVPAGQRDAAVAAALGIYRYAGCSECVDVAVDRALRNFERFGQRARRTATPRLQQQQERDEPVGFHDSIQPHVYDRRRQVSARASYAFRRNRAPLAESLGFYRLSWRL